jgi:hypothetical protein
MSVRGVDDGLSRWRAPGFATEEWLNKTLAKSTSAPTCALDFIGLLPKPPMRIIVTSASFARTLAK